jgi:osmotically-inducible protein OsmY
LLALAALVGCTNSSNPNVPNSAPVTTNKPVISDSGSAPVGSQSSDEATRRDNTAVNARDDGSAKTPLDQGQNSTDVTVTADIRKAIVNKSNMSINARNVKIITEKGHVTLRGPVDSQNEKDAIEQIAKDRAGADKVDSHLEIASDKAAPKSEQNSEQKVAPKPDSTPE